MTKLENYWQTKEEWYDLDEEGEPVIRDDAPEAAKESFKTFLKQRDDALKRGAL